MWGQAKVTTLIMCGAVSGLARSKLNDLVCLCGFVFAFRLLFVSFFAAVEWRLKLYYLLTFLFVVLYLSMTLPLTYIFVLS